MTDIFKQAAEVIESRGWIQGGMETPRGVCLTGALRICSPQPGDWLIARAVARHRGHGEEWNDYPGRTRDGVIRWLRTTKPITDEVLAEVFGPQWLQIVALIRRAATLNGDEWLTLDMAFVGVFREASDALEASRLAAFNETRVRAWSEASGAAREVARSVVRALVVRDLIGKHGFTQEHYDTLTMPWRKVIGPIHPDDVEVQR